MTPQNLKRSIHKGVNMRKWYIRFYTVYKFFDVCIKDDECECSDDVANKYIIGKYGAYLKFYDKDNNNPIFINQKSIVAFEILPYAFPSITR